MADKRISEFAAATAAAAADLFVMVQGGINKKITIANLFANINTPVKINPLLADVDMQVAGDTDANLLFTDASTDRVGVGTATPAQKLDVNGSLGTNGVVVHKSVTVQSTAGAVSLTTRSTVFDTTTTLAATLAVGTTPGQSKVLLSKNTGATTITVTNGAGFTTIVLTGIGQTATLEWFDSKWFITGTRGATVS